MKQTQRQEASHQGLSIEEHSHWLAAAIWPCATRRQSTRRTETAGGSPRPIAQLHAGAERLAHTTTPRHQTWGVVAVHRERAA